MYTRTQFCNGGLKKMIQKDTFKSWESSEC